MPEMNGFDRITHDPNVMGGKPCIRGMRVTVGVIVGLIASGHSAEEILRLYPYLEAEDIPAALRYAAWRSKEQEIPLGDDEGSDRHESVARVGEAPPSSGT
jgi:uncharacterized protein (DUF433 family)